MLVTLVAGVAAIALFRGGTATPETTAAAPPAATVAATPSADPPTSPAAATPSSTPSTPSATPTTAPAATGDDPVAFVQGYYALLPGNTEAAFAMLGPDAQARSGGRAGYDRFYGGLQSVSLQNARRTGDTTAEATVVFVGRDGRTSSEPYRFVMGTGADGRTIMESFSRA